MYTVQVKSQGSGKKSSSAIFARYEVAYYYVHTTWLPHDVFSLPSAYTVALKICSSASKCAYRQASNFPVFFQACLYVPLCRYEGPEVQKQKGYSSSLYCSVSVTSSECFLTTHAGASRATGGWSVASVTLCVSICLCVCILSSQHHTWDIQCIAFARHALTLTGQKAKVKMMCTAGSWHGYACQ